MSEIWKPKVWLAVVQGIFLQPFVFLYLHKPVIFVVYLLLSVSANLVDWPFAIPLSLIFVVICPIHAYLIAKRYNRHSARKWYSRWWGMLTVCVGIFLSIFLIRSVFYDWFSVQEDSMSPYLDPQDTLIVKKYGYGGYGAYGISLMNTGLSDDIELQRGKVYAFYPPDVDNNIVYVKRLIAKPGDSVEIQGNQISINGLPLKTTLLTKNTDFSLYEEVSDGITYQIKIKGAEPFFPDVSLIVPDDSYFFLGDNRDNSADSRLWGTLPSTRFVGEVVYVFHQ